MSVEEGSCQTKEMSKRASGKEEFSKFKVWKSVPKGKSKRWRRRRGAEEDGLVRRERERGLLRLERWTAFCQVGTANLLSWGRPCISHQARQEITDGS